MEGKSESAQQWLLPAPKGGVGGTTLQTVPHSAYWSSPRPHGNTYFQPDGINDEEDVKGSLSKDFQAHYPSLSTFGHVMVPSCSFHQNIQPPSATTFSSLRQDMLRAGVNLWF